MARLQLEDWENLLEEVESIKHDFETKIQGELEHQFSDKKAFPFALRKLVTEMLNNIYRLHDEFDELVQFLNEEVVLRSEARSE